MADVTRPVIWGNTEAYEAYMGRWSRSVAEVFVEWLAPASGLGWLDVGCGTGALTRAILARAAPSEVVGIDPSREYVGAALANVPDPRARFEIGDARELPFASDAYDVVVAGLALNFVPEPEKAVAEMTRVARPGGVVAVYVWDYAGKMQMVRSFWHAAITLDPEAAAIDQSRQFPFCQPEPLTAHFASADLAAVTVDALVIPTAFRDFDDFWRPHLLGGSGVAQRYVASLGEPQRAALRERLRETLPFAADGSIPMTARAWAVRGRKG